MRDPGTESLGLLVLMLVVSLLPVALWLAEHVRWPRRPDRGRRSAQTDQAPPAHPRPAAHPEDRSPTP